MKTTVTLEVDGVLGRMTLRPDPETKPNTLDLDVLSTMDELLDTVAGNTELRVLLVESASPKYFVVGANIKALQDIDVQSIHPWIHRGHEVFGRFQKLDIPAIAVVRGYAYGGGLELALACDMIYASEDARFALPEAGLGFVPGWGGTQRLPRRIGAPRAKRMIFTGRPVSAPEAESLGLIAFRGADEDLDTELAATVEAIAKNRRNSVRTCSELINGAFESPESTRAFEEAAASSVCLSDGDTQRRLRDFFDQRT